MKQEDEFRQFLLLLEEYIRLEYNLKRSGVPGSLIRGDHQISGLLASINTLANERGLSKGQLRQLFVQVRNNRRSAQNSKLREARKTPGLKARKKVASNAASRPGGASVYSLPTKVKHWTS